MNLQCNMKNGKQQLTRIQVFIRLKGKGTRIPGKQAKYTDLALKVHISSQTRRFQSDIQSMSNLKGASIGFCQCFSHKWDPIEKTDAPPLYLKRLGKKILQLLSQNKTKSSVFI